MFYNFLFFRRGLRREAPLHPVAQPRGERQARHRHEGDRGGQRPQGHHSGARAHRVLGQQDHPLLGPRRLPPGLLLDIQVSRDVIVFWPAAGKMEFVKPEF